MLKKQKSIEATIKYILNFVKIVLWWSLFYLVLTFQVAKIDGEKWYIGVINAVFLLGIYLSISRLIKEILNLYRFNNVNIGDKFTLYTLISYLYKALSITKSAIEIVIIKDIVFQINGWNLNKTIKEYWKELLKNHQVYILHEDQYKKNPRLWLIRGGSCVDIIDVLQKCKIYESHKEYIKLTDVQIEELLKRRRSKGFDDNDYYE